MFVFANVISKDEVKVERLPPSNRSAGSPQPLKDIRYAVDHLVLAWDCKGVLVAMPQKKDNFFSDMNQRQKVMHRLQGAGYKVRIVDAPLYDQARILYRFPQTHALYDNIAGVFITEDYISACVFQKESVGYLCIEQIKVAHDEPLTKIVSILKRFRAEYLPEDVVIVEDGTHLAVTLLLLLKEAKIKCTYHEYSRESRSCHLLRWATDVFSNGKAEGRMPLTVAGCNFSWKVNGQTVDRIHSHEAFLPFSHVSIIELYRCKSVNLVCDIPFTPYSKCINSIQVPYTPERRLMQVAIHVDANRIVDIQEFTNHSGGHNITYTTFNGDHGKTCLKSRALRICGVLLGIVCFIVAVCLLIRHVVPN